MIPASIGHRFESSYVDLGREEALPALCGASTASPRGSLDLRATCAIIAAQCMSKKSFIRKRLSRQERHNLDIEIGFLEGVVRRDPQYVQALQILGDDYTRRGRFAEGLKVDEVVAKLRPEDALVQYNLACSYSLTDQCELAVRALERALNLGYRDFKWLAQDPDLEKLRKHPLYRKIRAMIRSLQVKIS